MDLEKIVSSLDMNKRGGVVLKGVLLVAFWGMARLGELTHHKDHPEIFVCRGDVKFSKDQKRATIHIWMAKTAAPGEDQFISLWTQPNILDPIKALKDLLGIETSFLQPLFPGDDLWIPIKVCTINSLLKRLGPKKDMYWSGHSMRIGGASLRNHLGVSIDKIKKHGRWRSSAYKLYIRPYSKTFARQTKLLAAKLNSSKL